MEQENYEIEQPSMDDLNGADKNEYKMSKFAAQLMHGVDVDGHWFRIVKLNDQKYKDDPNRFEVDYGIERDGEIVGYIDPEEKTMWRSGECKYPRINIPLYPMAHWKRGSFNGRHTNKLVRFSQKPDLSFWMGARTDYEAYIIVPFKTMIAHGTETTQGTRYTETPLPVIAVANEHCVFIYTEDDFIDYFIKEFKAWSS